MKKFKILGLSLIFICYAVVVFAVKDKEIPPWMEDVKVRGKSTYLVPKGAKREIIGSQVVIEVPNEYVARRLYEMEGYLEKRLGEISEKQEHFSKEFEELKKAVEKFEGFNEAVEELEELKGVVEELKQAKEPEDDS